jgi:uncharacterized membrane protein
VVGVLFVLYLLYAELFLIDAICLWCTAAHIAAVGLAAGVAFAVADELPPEPPSAARQGSGRRRPVRGRRP